MSNNWSTKNSKFLFKVRILIKLSKILTTLPREEKKERWKFSGKFEEPEKYTHSDACNEIKDIFKKNTLIDVDIARNLLGTPVSPKDT
jgi:hypothetical protein